jgi:hypothetical protein
MPSTTIIAQPQQLMPAYNPIKYIIDNTNKNEPGFRYIFSIYPATGSHTAATLVAQYRVLPVFGTGYGEQDISMLMQSLVTYDETGIYNQAPYNSSESWYQYDVDLGFEYIDNIDYINSLQESGGGDVEIHFNAHGFIAGDQVVVVQADGGVANPTVEGLHTVLYADTNFFVINARWDTVTIDSINGTVTYADLRKTQVLDDEVIEDQEIFNGAYNNWTNTGNQSNAFPSAYFLANNSNSLLMTSNFAGQYHPAAAFQGAQFYYNLRVYAGATYTVRFYDMSNTQIDAYLFIPASDGIYAVFVGPTALVAEDYYVRVFSDIAGFSMDYYYFTYDNRCTINDQQLIYLDRMGSWQSFAFQLRTYEKGQITREQYNQHIDGQVSGSQWVGVDLQKGFRTYNTNVTKTFDLNTNWMGEYDATRFQELLTSPQVYYLLNGAEIFAACTIDATSFEVFSQKNKKLIKQSVTIKLAQQDPING